MSIIWYWPVGRDAVSGKVTADLAESNDRLLLAL